MARAARRSLVAPLPTIIPLTFFPITPGGVGQRELVFVRFLAPLGIGPSDATAASLVTMSMTLCLAAVGGALFAIDTARDRRAERVAQAASRSSDS